MKKIEISQYIQAVEARANQIGKFAIGLNLSLKERAICEANVYFLNQIIEKINDLEIENKYLNKKSNLLNK